MSLIHRQQVAEPAAIFPRPPHSFHAPSAERTFFCWHTLLGVRLVIYCPPLGPAGITAKPSHASWSPLRLILFPSVWTDLFRPLPASPLLQHLPVVVRHTALIAAKPPPPSGSLLPLFYCRSTLRTDIYLAPIVPFRICTSTGTRCCNRPLAKIRCSVKIGA